jgi:hypothetical protein
VWYRVFGDSASVEPADLLEALHQRGVPATGRFRGDDEGWFQAALHLLPDAAPILLDRYLAQEADVRHELNTWAAWLETTAEHPQRDRVLYHIIAAQQVFTAQVLEMDEELAEACLLLCRALAARCAGVYQVDGQGFFSAAGELLVAE